MNPAQEEATQFHTLVEPISSLDAQAKIQGRWNHQEHLKFLNAIVRYGKDWKKVQDQIVLRTGAQVRSHAQKYFLKINKIIKDRKKIKGKKMPEITETQLQLKEYFSCHALTCHTPKQIIQLLKIQKVGIKSIIEESCYGSEKVKIQQLLSPTAKQQKKKAVKLKIPEQVSKINYAIQNEVNALHNDSSYFESIMRVHKDFLLNGGSFASLIDYGGDSKKIRGHIEEQETSAQRKFSFSNYEGQIKEE